MQMPKPDETVIARRSELVAAFREFLPASGVVVDEATLKAF